MALGSLNDLYRDKVILDHCRNPRNSAVLELPDVSCEAINPFCGDEIRFQINLDDSDRVMEVGFQGEGCAINQAAGSIVSEALNGLTLTDVLDLSKKFSRIMEASLPKDVVVADKEAINLGELSALYKVREFPVRVKCALLVWSALDSGISTLA